MIARILIRCSSRGATFPDEVFWQPVDCMMPTNNGGQALLVMALEGAFVAPYCSITWSQRGAPGRRAKKGGIRRAAPGRD